MKTGKGNKKKSKSEVDNHQKLKKQVCKTASTPNTKSFEEKILENLSELAVRLNGFEKHINEIHASTTEITEMNTRLNQMQKDITDIRSTIAESSSKKETIIGLVNRAKMIRLGIPTTNLKELNDLEKSLEKQEYFQSIVDTLVVIGGESGNAQGSKVLGHIMRNLISAEFLKSISWSGRSANGRKDKIALQEYNGIRRVFYFLCRKADKEYDSAKCDHDIKYKLIKRANDKRISSTMANVSQTDKNDENIGYKGVDQHLYIDWKKKLAAQATVVNQQQLESEMQTRAMSSYILPNIYHSTLPNDCMTYKEGPLDMTHQSTSVDQLHMTNDGRTFVKL